MNWAKESEGQGFTVYPEGTYKVRIDNYEVVTAKTGTLQIRWSATIIEPDEYQNKKLTEHTALTERALWKLAGFVKSLNVDVDKLGTMDTDSDEFYQLLNVCKYRTACWRLTVGVGQNGKERNEVVDYAQDPDQGVLEVIKDEDLPDCLEE